MKSLGEHQTLGNFILDSLPHEEYEVLRTHLKLVKLQQNERLVKLREPITQVYFPVTAVVSWLNSTIEGDTVEVGMTGFEGIVGTTLLFNQEVAPWEVEVQLTGEAFQISAQAFVNALQHAPVLRQKMGDFAYLKMMQLTQSVLCNRFHTVEQRLCRWLLAAQDRAGTSELLLTRDILAKMIGSTRPAVSIVTGTLQSAGLIRAVRGKVTILDRSEMEEATCECYHILKQQFDTYISR
jgi:CRP-like cAMP-binding protein